DPEPSGKVGEAGVGRVDAATALDDRDVTSVGRHVGDVATHEGAVPANEQPECDRKNNQRAEQDATNGRRRRRLVADAGNGSHVGRRGGDRGRLSHPAHYRPLWPVLRAFAGDLIPLTGVSTPRMVWTRRCCTGSGS